MSTLVTDIQDNPTLQYLSPYAILFKASINKLLLRQPLTLIFRRKMHAEDFDTRAGLKRQKLRISSHRKLARKFGNSFFTLGKWPAKKLNKASKKVIMKKSETAKLWSHL